MLARNYLYDAMDKLDEIPEFLYKIDDFELRQEIAKRINEARKLIVKTICENP